MLETYIHPGSASHLPAYWQHRKCIYLDWTCGASGNRYLTFPLSPIGMLPATIYAPGPLAGPIPAVIQGDTPLPATKPFRLEHTNPKSQLVDQCWFRSTM
ncbi:hypothetical protein BD309DRAFT_49525 [Dichomitus squalens]|nr:hypothetical protein BD309DRAFT_49525 [Dichomitus squalens]